MIQLISVLGIGIIMTFLFIVYMPYYNYKLTVIQAQFVAIYTWSGICAIVATNLNNIDHPGPAVLFYVGCPCIWI